MEVIVYITFGCITIVYMNKGMIMRNKLNKVKIFIDTYCIETIYDLSVYDLQKLIVFNCGQYDIKIYKYYIDRCEFKRYTYMITKLNDKSLFKSIKLIDFKVNCLY